MDGVRPWEGRVEVLHKGQWGTICHDYWEKTDGEVVCRQLGLGSAERVYHGSYFGPGEGPIWQNHVYCQGTEEQLVNCHLRSFTAANHGCNHWMDASVTCSKGSSYLLIIASHRSLFLN